MMAIAAGKKTVKLEICAPGAKNLTFFHMKDVIANAIRTSDEVATQYGECSARFIVFSERGTDYGFRISNTRVLEEIEKIRKLLPGKPYTAAVFSVMQYAMDAEKNKTISNTLYVASKKGLMSYAKRQLGRYDDHMIMDRFSLLWSNRMIEQWEKQASHQRGQDAPFPEMAVGKRLKIEIRLGVDICEPAELDLDTVSIVPSTGAPKEDIREFADKRSLLVMNEYRKNRHLNVIKGKGCNVAIEPIEIEQGDFEFIRIYDANFVKK